MISHGDPLIFITRPISAAFIGVGLFVMITSYFRIKKAMQREGEEGARAEKEKVD
jgi:TctA family transporter